MKATRLVSWLLVVMALGSQAQPPDTTASSPLVQLFTHSFNTLYESNRCGENVLAFTQLAAQHGLVTPQSYILQITHRGGTELDPVWGLKARGEGLKRWMFHAVFESDGLIFDFDFGDQPRVVSVQQYFHEMFVDLQGKRAPLFFSDPLKDYMVKRVPAADYLDYVLNPHGPSKDYPEQGLGSFLSHVKIMTCSTAFKKLF